MDYSCQEEHDHMEGPQEQLEPDYVRETKKIEDFMDLLFGCLDKYGKEYGIETLSLVITNKNKETVTDMKGSVPNMEEQLKAMNEMIETMENTIEWEKKHGKTKERVNTKRFIETLSALGI